MAWERSMKPLLGGLREGGSVQRSVVEAALQAVPSTEASGAAGVPPHVTVVALR